MPHECPNARQLHRVGRNDYFRPHQHQHQLPHQYLPAGLHESTRSARGRQCDDRATRHLHSRWNSLNIIRFAGVCRFSRISPVAMSLSPCSTRPSTRLFAASLLTSRLRNSLASTLTVDKRGRPLPLLLVESLITTPEHSRRARNITWSRTLGHEQLGRSGCCSQAPLAVPGSEREL